MLRIKVGRRVGLWLAGLALLTAIVVPTALAKAGAAPTAKQKKAKATFSTTCATCHKLKAAGATFGIIGPNLDKVPLTQALYIKAITKGGASVMTKAAVAKYTTTMVAYGGVFSATDINNLAAYVYESTHVGAKGVYK